MWWKVASIFLALQISTAGIALNNVNGSVLQNLNPSSVVPTNSITEIVSHHRIIKRFTPRFKFPKPQLPTLPRPTFPFPVFNRELPKGENGKVPKSKKRQKPTPPSHPDKAHEDRTLLAAKKAILLKKAIIAKKAILAKKAIILAKLKKKAILKKKKKLKKKVIKKGAILYGLKQASKLKGFTLKAPIFHVSFGGPKIKGADKDKEEEAEVYSSNENQNSSGESESDEDDDDDLDEDDDDDSKPQVNPNNYQAQANANQQQQALVPQQQMIQPQVQQQPMTYVQQQASIMQQASMMQQLQQQLQQKQQEQLNQQQQQPQLLNAQQQAQAVIITPSPMLVTTETYTSKKKASKKSKKKKKIKPRPVDLGVKANLYKKFDRLTKKATGQLTSYIQIDIDFFRSGHKGRAAIDDMIEPGRFVSRTAAISAQNSNEDFDYVGEIEVPGNFFPSWEFPNWQRQYPLRSSNHKTKCDENVENSCNLKPIYVLFKHEGI